MPGLKVDGHISTDGFLSEDIVISFSKKRYRTSVPVTARLGTSIVTVQASARNSQESIHYSISSVNSKRYGDKTALFQMDPVSGSVFYNYPEKSSGLNNTDLILRGGPVG